MEIITREEAIEKGLTHYFTGEPCSKGHISKRYTKNSACFQCAKEYREENKEKIKNLQANWRQNNKRHVREYMQEYEKKHLEERTRYKRQWFENKCDEDKTTLTGHQHRKMLTKLLTKQNHLDDTHARLGYSADELRNHIESLMLEGMTWENRGEWHVTRITPLPRMIEKGETNPAVTNALSNIIPMWAEDNFSKGKMTLEEWLREHPEKEEMYGCFVR